MNIRRSKTGLPTITENGGGSTNTGHCTIICGGNGQKLKPIFIPRGRSNQDHAIFVVRPGVTHLVTASRGKRGESATVYKVISVTDTTAETEVIAEYENGDGNIPPQFQDAVNAALKKVRCYHCREPHYVAE